MKTFLSALIRLAEEERSQYRRGAIVASLMMSGKQRGGSTKATTEVLGAYHHESKTYNNEVLTHGKANPWGYEYAHVQENFGRIYIKN